MDQLNEEWKRRDGYNHIKQLRNFTCIVLHVQMELQVSTLTPEKSSSIPLECKGHWFHVKK